MFLCQAALVAWSSFYGSERQQYNKEKESEILVSLSVMFRDFS
jgi:hypothetical protein